MKKFKIISIVLLFILIDTLYAESIVVNINGIKSKTILGKEETRIKSIITGNHHCSHSCKGEPTRTPYRIDYNVLASKFKIIDAKIECGSGPCAYSGDISVKHTETSAWATFDVWSRPTTWTLNVTVKPIKIISGMVEQIDSDEVEKGKTFIVEHDINKYIDVEIETKLPKLGDIRMNPKSPIKPFFKKIGMSKFGNIYTYTIQYLGE